MSMSESYLPHEADAYYRETGLPWVTLTYAQSLDGSLTLKQGIPSPVSGRESMHITHRLRASHAGILVGIETVLSDNPSLTVRLVEGEHPQPIVLDSRLRLPADCNLLRNPRGVWLASNQMVNTSRPPHLQTDSVKLIEIPQAKDGRLCLVDLLKVLGKLGLRSLMVEGGARVITSFLQQRLPNRVVMTLAPTFAGGYAAVHSLGEDRWPDLPRLCRTQMMPIGSDFLLWGELER